MCNRDKENGKGKKAIGNVKERENKRNISISL